MCLCSKDPSLNARHLHLRLVCVRALLGDRVIRLHVFALTANPLRLNVDTPAFCHRLWCDETEWCSSAVRRTNSSTSDALLVFFILVVSALQTSDISLAAAQGRFCHVQLSEAKCFALIELSSGVAGLSSCEMHCTLGSASLGRPSGGNCY